MQIGSLQTQGGKYGFDIRSALPAIVGGEHYQFRGSQALLGVSAARAEPRSRKGSSDV